jgi:hypothetical protein
MTENESSNQDLAAAFWQNDSTWWAQKKVWFDLANSRQVDLSVVEALETIAQGTSPDDEDLKTFAAGPLEDFALLIIEERRPEVAQAILQSPTLSPLLAHVRPFGITDQLKLVAEAKHPSAASTKPRIQFTKKAIADYWQNQHLHWAHEKVDHLIKKDRLHAVQVFEAIASSAPNKQRLSRFSTGEFYQLLESVVESADNEAAKAILESSVLQPLFKYGKAKEMLGKIKEVSNQRLSSIQLASKKSPS